MIQITDSSQCCGCTACENVCPKRAISMTPDSLGFLYPNVDKNLCIDCGLCNKVCSFNDNYDKSENLVEPIAYAARHKNMVEIETSRSGAAFIAISDWILEHGGVVYGVGYKDHFRVAHKRATTVEQRNEFKGSKYVQSDLTGIFDDVVNDLKNNLFVLFSGTPCQTAGLHSLLSVKHIDKTRLYLCDIVCHGVPSPYIWRDYLAYIEKKQHNIIAEVNFRDKQRFGWKEHKESFRFIKDTDTYTFYQHIMFRYSCGECHFANIKRPSDITLADFWGWEKTDTAFNVDNKGCSLVLINTEKGKNLFEDVKISMNVILAKLEDCIQPNLQNPTVIHIKRRQFEQDYVKKGFVYVMKKYGNAGWQYKAKVLKRKITNLLTWWR